MIKVYLKWLLSFGILTYSISYAQNTLPNQLALANTKTPYTFPLVDIAKAANIYIDKEDAEVVNIAANCFSKDVESVTDKLPEVKNIEDSYQNYMIIAGTIGHNKLIDKLIQNQTIDMKQMVGKWETFGILLVNAPFKNVKQALVIVGSDYRGTAYGLFQLSNLIGVSPYKWWADVTPVKQKTLYISGTAIYGPPSVKYRGIFINDEDWGIHPWAVTKMDADIKDIGPNTYTHVCELLLRLKANFLWPAMHPCTKAFWYYPENPKVAARYSIALGASHCEPMLRDNVFEWNKNYDKEFGIKPGTWSYDVNRGQIYPYWEARVKQSKNQDALYTVGMRGIHDGGMPGGTTKEGKIKLLEEVITDQRKMLESNLTKPADKIPQIFCPYKEVLDLYQSNMKLPDDITIVWPDDNFGYIRQLSNKNEQKRLGGSGIYYHLSYWGAPADYLWLSSNSPSLISYEMSKAYHFGADKVWVFNVGDIKPAELETQFAMELAWDINSWTPEKAVDYTKYWAEKTFGKEYASEIAAIKNEYYHLAAAAKPEHLDKVSFSLEEAKNRIEAYQKIKDASIDLGKRIPTSLKDAYYELVQYPVEGACFMNEKIMGVRIGKFVQKEDSKEADAFFEKAGKAFENIQISTNKYNRLADGKWNGMMNCQPRNLDVFKMPSLIDSSNKNKKPELFKTVWTTKPRQIIPATHFSQSKDAEGTHIVKIKGLGISEEAVTAMPIIEQSYADAIHKAPMIEYSTDLIAGDNQIVVKCLPTFRLYDGFKLQYAISVNDDAPQTVNLNQPDDTSSEWKQNVLRGYSVGKTTHRVTTTGKATIKIYLLDPSVVISKIEVL